MTLEANARKNLCHKTIGLAPTFDKAGDRYLTSQAACEGSGCMAWRWIPNEEREPLPPMPEYILRDVHAMASWNMRLGERKPPVEGYCGLLPRPEA